MLTLQQDLCSQQLSCGCASFTHMVFLLALNDRHDSSLSCVDSRKSFMLAESTFEVDLQSSMLARSPYVLTALGSPVSISK
jgi:hypothetical protein